VPFEQVGFERGGVVVRGGGRGEFGGFAHCVSQSVSRMRCCGDFVCKEGREANLLMRFIVGDFLLKPWVAMA
jgi:hypothetical protein